VTRASIQRYYRRVSGRETEEKEAQTLLHSPTHDDVNAPYPYTVQERPSFVHPTGHMNYSPLWITVNPYTLWDVCGRNSVYAGIATRSLQSLQ
jgi:hypothetical protein